MNKFNRAIERNKRLYMKKGQSFTIFTNIVFILSITDQSVDFKHVYRKCMFCLNYQNYEFLGACSDCIIVLNQYF